MNRKFALAVTLAAGVALAPVAADAAFLNLTNGTSFDTPSGNNVLGSGTTLLDNATLATTEDDVTLTFYFLGSESGYKNTLNVDGGTHTEADKYPASWPGSSVVGPVTQASAGPVDLFFTSSGFSGQLEPGQVDTSKSIAFAYLANTSGAISTTPTDIVLFALDDGGARSDADYDDYVGYVVADGPVAEGSLTAATLAAPVAERVVPVAPTPIPAALPMFVTAMMGLGLIGRRRMKATA
jgi:hypothetical protein